MNKVVLIGRLVRDPELKFTPGTGTAVTSITIAVDRKVPNKDGKREADFVPIVFWGKQAEFVANYVSKGKLIGVSGRLQIRSYDAKDGSKRTFTEVVADEVQLLEKMNQGSNQGSSPSRSSSNEESYDDMTPIEDGEIPF